MPMGLGSQLERWLHPVFPQRRRQQVTGQRKYAGPVTSQVLHVVTVIWWSCAVGCLRLRQSPPWAVQAQLVAVSPSHSDPPSRPIQGLDRDPGRSSGELEGARVVVVRWALVEETGRSNPVGLSSVWLTAMVTP